MIDVIKCRFYNCNRYTSNELLVRGRPTLYNVQQYISCIPRYSHTSTHIALNKTGWNMTHVQMIWRRIDVILSGMLSVSDDGGNEARLCWPSQAWFKLFHAHFVNPKVKFVFKLTVNTYPNYKVAMSPFTHGTNSSRWHDYKWLWSYSFSNKYKWEMRSCTMKPPRQDNYRLENILKEVMTSSVVE